MGNLAHSLKTPLAVLQVSLETDDQQQDKLNMQEQLNRMESQLDAISLCCPKNGVCHKIKSIIINIELIKGFFTLL
jgi:hypothetical protein